jgi:23S rRNA pseudouridine1911/1915/1917 synthase
VSGDPAKTEDLHFRVDPHWAGFRLDHYLRAMRPSISRSKIQRFVRAELVRVNGEPRPANWKVQVDDLVVFTPNFPGEDLEAGRRIPLDLIHEDADIVVVAKAAGLHVHPVTGHRHDTLLNALYWHYRPEDEAAAAAFEAPTLAHRLDRDTSGIIVAAKHRAAREFLQDEFEARRPRKTYLALTAGQPRADEGRIDLPLAAAADPRARRKMRVADAADPAGKRAATRWRVRARYAARPRLDEGAALLEIDLETGRQHQIRVHLDAIGHPLLADDRYGNAGPLPLSPDFALRRLALHAARLEIRHPRDQRWLRLEAALPRDLERACALLAEDSRPS